MCGIVGIHLKNPELRPRLGAISSPMLMEMSERGPDSSGVAVYRETDDWMAMALGVPGACAPAGRWRELRSRADAGAGRVERAGACATRRVSMSDQRRIRGSATFPPHVIAEIQRAGAEGIYSIRGAGAKRPVPDFDDLVFLGASVSRYPLEGYREACATKALGADAVSIGMAALIALNCNAPLYEADYEALGTRPGACDRCQTGMCPVGIATQRPELEARLDPEEGVRRVRNYLSVLTMECQTLARACGKSHVHNLEPEDMVALTVEAAAMAQVPLAGTNWIPGRG